MVKRLNRRWPHLSEGNRVFGSLLTPRQNKAPQESSAPIAVEILLCRSRDFGRRKRSKRIAGKNSQKN
jgi:hypothetical protein